eukprot:CAMPEP_0172163320 /NCGR_PEP_ID=MMETSP1050-20130122/7207_1 /TAXON_ID=233186 /ORGANISM="Cryptomonas curvata, Strain CCAP979/52" /LENGTH=225 /DNA_ID=CAMNT_0012833499 /DNA_START=114 /DNA_END=793 /DNA_ORIENTATION=-
MAAGKGEESEDSKLTSQVAHDFMRATVAGPSHSRSVVRILEKDRADGISQTSLCKGKEFPVSHKQLRDSMDTVLKLIKLCSHRCGARIAKTEAHVLYLCQNSESGRKRQGFSEEVSLVLAAPYLQQQPDTEALAQSSQSISGPIACVGGKAPAIRPMRHELSRNFSNDWLDRLHDSSLAKRLDFLRDDNSEVLVKGQVFKAVDKEHASLDRGGRKHRAASVGAGA